MPLSPDPILSLSETPELIASMTQGELDRQWIGIIVDAAWHDQQSGDVSVGALARALVSVRDGLRRDAGDLLVLLPPRPRGADVPVTRDEIEAMKIMHRAGQPIDVIGRAIHRHTRTVRSFLAQEGVRRAPGPQTASRQRIDERRESVARHRRDGMSVAEMAVALRVSEQTIKIDIRALREQGVDVDPPRRAQIRRRRERVASVAARVGCDPHAIAREMGEPVHTVRYDLEQPETIALIEQGHVMEDAA